MEARGSACHRLLGLLTGSALTGSGVDLAESLTGSGVNRARSLTGSGQTSGSGQKIRIELRSGRVKIRVVSKIRVGLRPGQR